jgi:hypothetical protein
LLAVALPWIKKCGCGVESKFLKGKGNACIPVFP